MNIRSVLLLIATVCCTTLGAQSGGPIATDIKIDPAGMSMDAGITGQQYWKYPAFTATDVSTGNPDNYLTWSVVEGVLPPGLKLIPDGDAVSGIDFGQGVCAMAGVPTRPGIYVFWVKVTDNFTSKSDVQRYAITIHGASDFAIRYAAVPDGEAGAGYSAVIGCTTIGGPFTWSWQAAPGSQIPPGLSLDTASTSQITTITGTPTTAGIYDFVVTVNNGSQSLSHTYHMEVDPQNPTILSANPIPSGQQGVHYGFQFRGTGGVRPYRWLCDNLPAGFTLNRETGYIECSAPNAGTYTFDLTLSGDLSGTGGANLVNQQFTLVINGGSGGAPLSITTPATLPAGVEGSAYQQALAATGGTSPYTWSATNVPAGFVLGTSGVLTAPPTALVAGTYTFDATAQDSLSASDTRTFSLTISAAPASTPGGSSGSSSGGSGCAAGGGALLPILLPVLLAFRGRRKDARPS